MEYLETMMPFGGGLNYDDDERVMQNTDGRVREYVMPEGDGTFGVLVPIKGNGLVSLPHPTQGMVRMIGSCVDMERNAVLLFLAGAGSYIVEVGDTVDYVVYNEPFGWDASTVIHSGVMDGKLYWADGDTHKLSIERAKRLATLRIQGATVRRYLGESLEVNQNDYVSVPGMGMYRRLGGNTVVSGEFNPSGYEAQPDMYYDVVSEGSLIKRPPVSTVEVYPTKLVGGEVLTDRAMRFTYCYIYRDKEQSRYASPSRVVMNMGTAGSVESFNAVNVQLVQGGEDVAAVRLLVEDVPTGTWYRVVDIDTALFNGLPSYTYTYRSGLRQEAVVGVDVGFDAVPIRAGALDLMNGAVVLGDMTEGYDSPRVDMAVTVREQEETEPTDVTMQEVFAQDFSTNPKFFRTTRVELPYGVDEFVPLGVRYTLRFTADGQDVFNSSVQSLGETGAAFRDRVMGLYNTVYAANLMFGSADITSSMNLVATAPEGDATMVAFRVVYGAMTMLRYVLMGLFRYVLDLPSFDGTVAQGQYVRFSYDLFSYVQSAEVNTGGKYAHAAAYGLSENFMSFKTQSTYEVSLKYFDRFKRTMPSRNSEEVLITGRYGLPKVLDVTIQSPPPSWAEYYKVCISESSVKDCVGIEVPGGGSISSVEGDSSGAIVELQIDGITRDMVGEDNTLYWSVGRIAPTLDDPGAVFVLFSNTTDMLLDSYHRGGHAAAFKLRGDVESVVVNGVSCWKVPMYRGVLWDRDTEHWEFLTTTGYIIVRKDIKSVAPSTSRIAIPTFSEQQEVEDGYKYSLNIASYINRVKTDDAEHNPFIPMEGHLIRLLKVYGSASASTLFVAEISEVKPGRVNDKGYFDKYIVTTSPVPINVDLSNGGMVEVFTMSNEQDALMFEEPTMRSIHGVGEQVSLSGWDTYVRSRKSINPFGDEQGDEYTVEDFRYSDDMESRYWSRGRVHTTNASAGQRHLHAALRNGGRVMVGTEINDSCRFDGGDINYLDETDGRIMAIKAISGNALKVIQQHRSVTQDIGMSLITRPDGSSEYVVSDRFFGSHRKSLYRRGTENPEGVVSVNGNLYYFDIQNALMIRDGQNGQFPISGKVSFGEHSHDYKMQRYFLDQAKYWRGKGLRIGIGYDEQQQSVWVTFKGADSTVNPDLPPTVIFHEAMNRWVSGMNETPDGYAFLGNRLYSFRNAIWEHGKARRMLYGKERESVVSVVFNSQPALMKLLDSIAVKMRGVNTEGLPTDFITIDILPSASYPEGMRTTVTKQMLRLEENAYRSDIGRNELTPGMEAMEAFFDGEDMRGYSGVVTLRFGSSDFELMAIDLGLTRSK